MSGAPVDKGIRVNILLQLHTATGVARRRLRLKGISGGNGGKGAVFVEPGLHVCQ
jgi:hypothetical protein